MATMEVVLLSSSPARAPGFAAMSSSPMFLSTSEPVQGHAQQRTGTLAALVPHKVMGFTSAARLFTTVGSNETNRDFMAHGTSLREEEGEMPQRAEAVKKSRETKGEGNAVVAKKPRKPRAVKAKKLENAADDDVLPKEKPAPKSRAKKADTAAIEGATKEKPARKPRAKKVDPGGQTSFPKGRVTKVSLGKDLAVNDKLVAAKKVSTSKDTPPGDEYLTEKNNPGAVSSHFPLTTEEDTDPFIFSFGDHLHLPEAAKRRTNWTPPKPTVTESCLVTIPNGGVCIQDTDTFENVPTELDLFGSFGYRNIDAAKIPGRTGATEGTRKRKLIELVKTNTSIPLQPESAAKTKAPKKKPRTITDLATAAYRTIEGECESAQTPAPLLQYVSFKNGEAATESRTLEGFKIPAKPRSKIAVKSSTKMAKVKKSDLPKLLSPQSALKQVEKQNFVFGTSSQLAREDSPTLLRDLQHAIIESNRLYSDPFAAIQDNPAQETPKSCFLGEKGIVLFPGVRNLWSAGSYGDFVDIATVDMTETPKISKEKESHCYSLTGCEQNTAKSLSMQSDEEWLRIDDTPLGPSKMADTTSESAVAASIVRDKSPSKAEATLSKASGNSPSKTKVLQRKNAPDFSSYPTAKLAQEIASYRFKPIKSRDTMIELLEKCWEAKQRPALGTLVANRALSTSPAKSPPSKKTTTAGLVSSPKRGRPRKLSHPLTAPPKRLVGRPRKTCSTKTTPVKAKKSTSTADDMALCSDSDTPLSKRRILLKKAQTFESVVEEISDSDSPITPSPPRRRASKVGSPPKALDLVSDDSVVLTPTSRQLKLHKQITKAITSVPPSEDPKNPNWHEKILLYDPIVLEDLTTWLNTGALQKVGYDGEIEPKEVKAWCLERSVCCLWRENLRGGARSRY